MKKIIVFIISLTLLSCLDISDPQAENIDEMEERTKNLEDSIVGLIETGITFLNKELKENLKADSKSNGEEKLESTDLLSELTGVWSEEDVLDGTTVFEINFDSDSLKTIKYLFTPTDTDREYNDSVDVDYLYDVSIKNIDNKRHKVSFYLTVQGKDFKEPMRTNPIWTIRQHFGWNDSFTISLTTHKGKRYDLEWVREY